MIPSLQKFEIQNKNCTEICLYFNILDIFILHVIMPFIKNFSIVRNNKQKKENLISLLSIFYKENMKFLLEELGDDIFNDFAFIINNNNKMKIKDVNHKAIKYLYKASKEQEKTIVKSFFYFLIKDSEIMQNIFIDAIAENIKNFYEKMENFVLKYNDEKKSECCYIFKI